MGTNCKNLSCQEPTVIQLNLEQDCIPGHWEGDLIKLASNASFAVLFLRRMTKVCRNRT